MSADEPIVTFQVKEEYPKNARIARGNFISNSKPIKFAKPSFEKFKEGVSKKYKERVEATREAYEEAYQKSLELIDKAKENEPLKQTTHPYSAMAIERIGELADLAVALIDAKYKYDRVQSIATRPLKVPKGFITRIKDRVKNYRDMKVKKKNIEEAYGVASESILSRDYDEAIGVMKEEFPAGPLYEPMPDLFGNSYDDMSGDYSMPKSAEPVSNGVGPVSEGAKTPSHEDFYSSAAKWQRESGNISPGSGSPSADDFSHVEQTSLSGSTGNLTSGVVSGATGSGDDIDEESRRKYAAQFAEAIAALSKAKFESSGVTNLSQNGQQTSGLGDDDVPAEIYSGPSAPVVGADAAVMQTGNVGGVLPQNGQQTSGLGDVDVPAEIYSTPVVGADAAVMPTDNVSVVLPQTGPQTSGLGDVDVPAEIYSAPVVDADAAVMQTGNVGDVLPQTGPQISGLGVTAAPATRNFSPEASAAKAEFEAKLAGVDSEIAAVNQKISELDVSIAVLESQKNVDTSILLLRGAKEAYQRKIEELESKRRELFPKARKSDLPKRVMHFYSINGYRPAVVAEKFGITREYARELYHKYLELNQNSIRESRRR